MEDRWILIMNIRCAILTKRVLSGVENKELAMTVEWRDGIQLPTQNSYDSIPSPLHQLLTLSTNPLSLHSPVLTADHGGNSMGPGQGRGSGCLAGRSPLEFDLAPAPGPARTPRQEWYRDYMWPYAKNIC